MRDPLGRPMVQTLDSRRVLSRRLHSAAYAVVSIVCDAVMLGAFLVCMRFIEGLFHTLWPGPEPMLFYRVPLSMVINAQESWLLLAFVVLSAISIIRAISVPALRHGA